MRMWGGVFLLLSMAASLAAQHPAAPARSGSPSGQASDQKDAKQTEDGKQTGLPAAQPNPVTTIHVPVNLVNVLFTVRDKKDRMVLDLTKGDFRLFEDNKPQAITNFSRETDLPLRIGILVDTSNSIRERLHFEQEAAIDFLSETLRPGKDLAFAVAFDVEPQLLQDYTDDADNPDELRVEGRVQYDEAQQCRGDDANPFGDLSLEGPLADGQVTNVGGDLGRDAGDHAGHSAFAGRADAEGRVTIRQHLTGDAAEVVQAVHQPFEARGPGPIDGKPDGRHGDR